jgi:formate hydrogenlyase subunit 6/NADH:ubiquinone oxidoreductase subunit I
MGVFIEVIKNLFKKPFTKRYPKEKVKAPEKYRGKIKFDKKGCIECGLCKMICPANAIKLGRRLKTIKAGKIIHRKITHPIESIDIGKCVSCGLCVEICPPKVISFTNKFETANKKKGKLIVK